ncbi:hypothetical protein [Brevibacterium daeguense]|nr:hypothetical protein [Brevibacterium daeguense]
MPFTNPYGGMIQQQNWEMYWEPSYVDLYASYRFRVRVDHGTRSVCVSGAVGNKGTVVATQSVKVALGVTVRIDGVLRSAERIYTMGQGIRPGDLVYTEPCMAVPLRYLDEDADAKYRFELLVDIYGEAFSDWGPGNNHSWVDWFTFSPRALETDQRFGDLPEPEGHGH